VQKRRKERGDKESRKGMKASRENNYARRPASNQFSRPSLVTTDRKTGGAPFKEKENVRGEMKSLRVLSADKKKRLRVVRVRKETDGPG